MDVGSLIVLAVGGLVAWAAIRLGMQRHEARLRSWRRAAADAGLESILERERFLGRELTGRAGTLSVRLERFKRGKGPSGTRIEIDGLEHGPFGLSFRREGLGTRLDRAIAGERDIETGDAAFDREVFVSGQPAMARAVLGAEARRAVRWLLNGRIPLRDGATRRRRRPGGLRQDHRRGHGERLRRRGPSARLRRAADVPARRGAPPRRAAGTRPRRSRRPPRAILWRACGSRA